MARNLILGTAGHIDHGKTSLVKALTGVDCDRLPEEKARGITIDIGFASLDLGEHRLGIVDVPGHERFIKNMLAGATGIDLAMLVVAADDSIMPQTREHMEILSLLGIRHGLVAVTKSDLVDAETMEVVELEIRELVAGTFLENAEIIRTSAHSGLGLEKLKESLQRVAAAVEDRAGSEWFRMAIDRCFVVQGHGTVVTGSVTSGRVAVGDEVEWLPRRERVRVRALHHHDLPVEAVHRGMRAAINLAGVHHEEVTRGQEIATPGYLLPSKVLTVQLRALSDLRKGLKHRLPARLHLGTAEVMSEVSLLDANQIEPGQWGLAQLFLEEPVTAAWGQPFVLRESSASVTLGGGRVLQPVAQKIRRRHMEMIERVEALGRDSEEERAQAVTWFGGFGGVTHEVMVRDAGIGPDESSALIARLQEAGILVAMASVHGKKILMHKDLLIELEDRLLKGLAHLHESQPLVSAHDRQKVQSCLSYLGDDLLVHAIVDRLVLSGKLIADQKRIARADFRPKLSGGQRRLRDKIISSYREAKFQPPEAASFAAIAGGNASSLRDLFEVCVAEGSLSKVTEDLYLDAEAESEMRSRILNKLREQPVGLSVAEIRDLLGTTRKYAVPFCEYLDRIELTRREGDLRVAVEPP